MTLKEWAKEIKESDLVLPAQILEDWAADSKEAAALLKESEEDVHEQHLEIEELKARIDAGPEWGNCRRGCPPAYLNIQGYCSPECELGLVKDIEHYRRQNQE